MYVVYFLSGPYNRNAGNHHVTVFAGAWMNGPECNWLVPGTYDNDGNVLPEYAAMYGDMLNA